MVLLSMTPAVAEVVQLYLEKVPQKHPPEPLLDSPAEGKPISHSQLIDISRYLKANGIKTTKDGQNLPTRLEELLKGCSVYTPPKTESKPKSSEYESLMARLRKEEEARAYQRMLDPSTSKTSSLRSPSSHHTHILAESNKASADEEDDITYSEVDRQIALIVNILVSIIACGVAIWVVARSWSVPARLAVSMVGSLVVGIAEVVIYTGYLRRLGEAKQKEKAKKEVISIADSWIIEGRSSTYQSNNNTTRLRATKGAHYSKS